MVVFHVQAGESIRGAIWKAYKDLNVKDLRVSIFTKTLDPRFMELMRLKESEDRFHFDILRTIIMNYPEPDNDIKTVEQITKDALTDEIFVLRKENGKLEDRIYRLQTQLDDTFRQKKVGRLQFVVKDLFEELSMMYYSGDRYGYLIYDGQRITKIVPEDDPLDSDTGEN